jgi:hypothetical protein
MSARALLPLIILSILLGPVGSAMSAGGAAPIAERPSSSPRTAPATPIIKPPIIKPSGSGPQKEAPHKITIDPKCVAARFDKCMDNCGRLGPLASADEVVANRKCTGKCSQDQSAGAGCQK